MDTIFMKSEKSKTLDRKKLLLNLTGKIDLRKKGKYVALSNLSIYYTWNNVKTSYKIKKIKIPALTWNEEFELPDRSYSVSNIEGYFEYILKNLK